ncbi:MAG: iron-containing alcohol dehydrogenase, partial [Clostridia bacterium]
MSESTVFRTPGETHLGVGAVRMVGPIARRCGARALLVTGARSAKASGALDAVSESLQEAGVEVVLYDRVGREPTLGMVDEARQLARESACDLIIGLGGGSPIDAAKAV